MALFPFAIKFSAPGADSTVRAIDSVRQAVAAVPIALAGVDAAFGVFSRLGDALASVGRSAFDSAVRMDSLVRGLATVSKDANDLRGQLVRLREVAKLPGLGVAEAIEGSLKLQSALLPTRLAERALSAFGNALASVGKGKSDLDGVITALSQISSKGTVSAEEINQIAERVPQIRALLKGAFGTADTEQIQKMGLTAVNAIERIVAQAEKLPRMTGGIRNLIENTSDAVEDALRPLGQGIVEMLERAGSGFDQFLDSVRGLGTQLGQVFAAVGGSGVLSETLNTLSGAIGQLSDGASMSPVIAIVSGLLSIVNNIPDAIAAAGEGVRAILHNIEVAGQKIAAAMAAMVSAMAIAVTDLVTLATAIPQLILQPWRSEEIGQSIKGALNPDKLLDNFNGLNAINQIGTGSFQALPSGGRFDLLADQARFADAIAKNIKPLREFPEGLNFATGGPLDTGKAKKSPLEELLARIERNTKKTADNTDLRQLATGGGDLARLGITPAELRGLGAGGGNVPALRMGDYGSNLERALIAMILNELRKQGAGVSMAGL